MQLKTGCRKGFHKLEVQLCQSCRETNLGCATGAPKSPGKRVMGLKNKSKRPDEPQGEVGEVVSWSYSLAEHTQRQQVLRWAGQHLQAGGTEAQRCRVSGGC